MDEEHKKLRKRVESLLEEAERMCKEQHKLRRQKNISEVDEAFHRSADETWCKVVWRLRRILGIKPEDCR